MKNNSAQKGSIVVLLLGIIFILVFGTIMFFYIYNQIKAEPSVDEIKNKKDDTNVIRKRESIIDSSQNKELKEIKVYFPKKDLSGCTRDITKDNFDFSVRKISSTQSLAFVAAGELLKGMTEEEKEKGYWSDIPEGVSVKSISITDGRAYVDLNDKIGDVSTCKGWLRLWQIKLTLTEIPPIAVTTFSVNGSTLNILQP